MVVTKHDNNTWNMWVAIVFGAVGYLLRTWGIPAGSLVLAVIGGLLETSVRQSLILSDSAVDHVGPARLMQPHQSLSQIQITMTRTVEEVLTCRT
ncbi:hypothetical protein CH253_20840 [Rhodococcus sp. 06-156-3C]|uniref:hypothetical protein n=1 Tax=Nocardiaceae TaxID=85025 RepID=UPI0005230012|nr:MULTISPECIES: hypothetical protein [Rhodococcus]OZD08708.1 hypothetical protein CH280_23675 [Rhodococcus sp. 06-156-4C]OZD17286.1 hypothetical protein CH253_20840 [Rhodococcus sp. 06-156-3C]OZD18623.1 hypothetical protein CH248_17660 [Rhodococcus sp. 06-156-4a]OZD25030.1 hypothetical protein CH247_27200 [Rhodococcus sp. 06-156-3b]OZD34188.1 hypothetical protein CH284_17285 [Rhodococcus sp. 06-156-3]